MVPGTAATMLIGSLCHEYFSFYSETSHTDSNWKHKIRVALRDRKNTKTQSKGINNILRGFKLIPQQPCLKKQAKEMSKLKMK